MAKNCDMTRVALCCGLCVRVVASCGNQASQKCEVAGDGEGRYGPYGVVEQGSVLGRK